MNKLGFFWYGLQILNTQKYKERWTYDDVQEMKWLKSNYGQINYSVSKRRLNEFINQRISVFFFGMKWYEQCSTHIIIGKLISTNANQYTKMNRETV